MSTATPQHAQKLEQLLQQEVSLTQQLLEILHRERNAVTNKEAEQLTLLAGEKQQQLTQLQNTSKQREALLQQSGLPLNRTGMDQLINALQSPQATRLWQQLADSAAQCQEQNRQLGMLIQREQNSVRQAQHILQRGTPNKPLAYNATGSTDNDTKTRPLAKA